MKTNAYIHIIFLLSIVVPLTSCLDNQDSSNSSKSGIPVLKGENLPEKTLSLTFDDGPNEHTERVAKYLWGMGIEATFFVNGRNVPGNEKLLEKMVEWGHLIGNHTQTHPRLDDLSSKKIAEEVKLTHDLIVKYTPEKERQFLRPPFGRFDERVSKALKSAGLDQYATAIHWDIGGKVWGSVTADWKCWDLGLEPRICANAMLNETKSFGKGIVLMHDTFPETFHLLVAMVERWKQHGYKFVRLDKVEL